MISFLARYRHGRAHATFSQFDRVRWRPDRCDRIALVLQGGGALGAYQAGVYQALHEAGIEPDWVSGVSIGAINSRSSPAIRRSRRLQRLRDFWERITGRKIWPYTPDGDIYRKARNARVALLTMRWASPASSSRATPSPWFSPAGAKDRDQLLRQRAAARDAADELVDFDLHQRRARSASRSARSTC